MNKSVEPKKTEGNNGEEGSEIGGFKENQRYKRQFLKTVVKSVYQPRNVVRMNGSMSTLEKLTFTQKVSRSF